MPLEYDIGVHWLFNSCTSKMGLNSYGNYWVEIKDDTEVETY